MRKTMPAAKLMPPMTSITTRKPTLPSERCGTIVAEKIVGSGRRSLSVLIAVEYTGSMARKTTRQALRAARSRKAAALKARKKMVAADAKAAQGALPQWSTAEIEEAFRRFHAADP